MPDLTMPLNVALVQTALQWQNPVANRQQLAEQISRIQAADIIVLPEMFTTGFSMQSEHIAEPEGDTLGWLQQQAQQIGAALVGSVATRTDKGCVNRCYFVTPDGDVSVYDKKHLFSFAGEHLHYTPGNEKIRLLFFLKSIPGAVPV